MPGWELGFCPPWLALVLLVLLWGPAPAAAQRHSRESSWQTLTGDEPLVVARGGISGLFPYSSEAAYSIAKTDSLSSTLLWCDVHLTKDNVGICLPDIKMDNCTDISALYPDEKKDHLLNNVLVSGWFPVDYEMADLTNVTLLQGIYTRTDRFDGQYGILSVDALYSQFKPPLWLNVPYNTFYSQHNLSMRSYLLSVTRRYIIDYVSSPEVSFLSSVQARLKRSRTRLIFQFLEAALVEQSTNQTYGSLVKNMTFIKTFASGILLPKSYIWPVSADLYLLPYSTIVLDAHKAGLEVFASEFANDNVIPYNYSYDPVAEYISFTDNGVFSVDGILTDFPITASAAIGCFSHANNNSNPANLSVISHYGASGVYPGCTDLAYQQAIADGADYIDCPVQVTKDGILVCMNSIDLFSGTSVVSSSFGTRRSVIPEIQSGPGVFTFNLTWEDIQKQLKPQISTPEINYTLVRNPLYKNAGKFHNLSRLFGHAAFYAEKLGFSITDSVQGALDDSGFSNQTSLDVIIMSTSSSVLKNLRQETKYRLMYMIDESIGDALGTSIEDIAGFAHSVAVHKESVYPKSAAFILGRTGIVKKLQAANLSVYAYLFMNEFVSQPWDFYSDPTIEINTYFQTKPLLESRQGHAPIHASCAACGLAPIASSRCFATGVPPSPVLTEADIVEPPLPPASPNATISPLDTSSPPPTQPPSAQAWRLSASLPLFFVMIAASLSVI
ncbi:unnamed protein product [Spirodela intermedia]|uniref:glycerophosphodiester phosphodiesterase n=1 Tax=Spirodela intermedia TaxID=51605 RepID=A0A7I8JJB2_SPIIN|nr:unnamed protein product [Spirodela intermedia]CAA6670160.1 unnamed protein product [Spirodela intermedia]